MRKFSYSILLFAISIVEVIAQQGTATITGSFTNLEPDSYYTYNATAGGLPSGAGGISYNWSFEGNKSGNVPVTSTIGRASNVQWDNTPDVAASPKRVYCSVTYYVQGQQQTTYSSWQNVDVKHIGAISSINISGTNRSNGQTHDLNCGSTTLSLSVPAVVTSPVAPVNYKWTFPAGFSPTTITTTSPSTSVTSNVAGAGVIKVEAQRIDGTTKTSIQVNIRRPLPVINSISSSLVKICSPTSQISVSASGVNADKFIWTPSANVRVNGSSSAQTIAGSSANIGGLGAGTFSVQAYSNACAVASTSSITGNVQLATLPNVNSLVYDFNNNPVNSLNLVSPYDNHYITLYPLDFTSYSWNQVWSSGIPSGVAGVNRFDFQLQPGQSLFFSPLSITNVCGTVTKAIEFWAPWSLVAYPNPATNQLSMDINNVNRLDLLPETIELISEKSGKVVKTITVSSMNKQEIVRDKRIQLDVKDLERGTYYLNIRSSKGVEKTEKTRVILQ